MINREKVIKGLECCIARNGTCQYKQEPICPYVEHCQKEDYAALQRDVLALLKEQEPILLENQHKPYGISTNANSPWISRCPRCGKKVEGKQTKFCKYCGQAVKWNERTNLS